MNLHEWCLKFQKHKKNISINISQKNVKITKEDVTVSNLQYIWLLTTGNRQIGGGEGGTRQGKKKNKEK